VRRAALLMIVALALPVAAQQKKPAKPAAHAKPTPQQIRKFRELEKKETGAKKQPRERRPAGGK
jgi:hypothetical protein